MKSVLELLQEKYYCRERTASDMNVLDYQSVLTEVKKSWALGELPDDEKYDSLRGYRIILSDVIYYKRKQSYYNLLKNFVNSPQDQEDFRGLYADIDHLRSMDIGQRNLYEQNFDLIKRERYNPKVDYFSSFIRLTYNILASFDMVEELYEETDDSESETPDVNLVMYEQKAFNDAKLKIIELYEIMVNQYFDGEL